MLSSLSLDKICPASEALSHKPLRYLFESAFPAYIHCGLSVGSRICLLNLYIDLRIVLSLLLVPELSSFLLPVVKSPLADLLHFLLDYLSLLNYLSSWCVYPFLFYLAGRLSRNNHPVDTPPIFLNTTFYYISAQYDALKAVNKEIIALYADISRMIVERQDKEGQTEVVHAVDI